MGEGGLTRAATPTPLEPNSKYLILIFKNEIKYHKYQFGKTKWGKSQEIFLGGEGGCGMKNIF